ncbi:hypothetical protein HPB48_011705 [Haemaphysalis longicornis]|uniref:FMN-dependent dehydrogenase domain-containing protein n=1 Tax=Haemaphysalis longicornis TaxID=44386 RepID=A0A9J6G176_HAELO|nr:hypothetical protein HPB48_011705 [Haemaphysalis longicornis]
MYVNQLDALYSVSRALRDSAVEVYMDGGVREAADVCKALALGARAVFIGRPVIWGLANGVSCSGGQLGVREV